MPLSLFAHIHGLAQAETAAPQVKSITTGLQPSIFFKSCFPQLMIQKQKTNKLDDSTRRWVIFREFSKFLF